MMLAALIPIERLVAPDRDGGVIDQLLVRGESTATIAFAKLIAHWLAFAPPVLVAALPAAANPREQHAVGPHREREQDRDEQEERNGQQRATAAPDAAQVAGDARDEHHSPNPMVRAFGNAIGVWLATSAAPPSARCAAMTASSRETASASSPFAGSSSSQNGAPLATARAIAARRRWPVASNRTGTSTSGSSASAASASSTAWRPPPSSRAQNASARISGSSGSSAACSVSSARGRVQLTSPPATRNNPAATRIRLDLPAPLGPVTSTALPASSANERAANKVRPPRMHVTEAKVSIGWNLNRP